MTKIAKTLEKMRINPRDYRITDLMVIAERLGITVRKGKGSHVTFIHAKWVEILTIPAHNPVKSIYIKKFVSLIDTLEESI